MSALPSTVYNGEKSDGVRALKRSAAQLIATGLKQVSEVDSVSGPFATLFGALIQSYPPMEAMARVHANVFMLGMTAQRLLQSANAVQSQPVETPEKSTNT